MNPADLLYGPDKLIEANHLNGLAAVHERRQEFTDAQRFYEEALAIYEELFGAHHLTTAVATRNLARVLRVQGKTAEAALMDDHADEILRRRGDGQEEGSAPFGGSSGFFELLGLSETEEPELEDRGTATAI